nr:sigma 54-interacting transcriptional regulator [uncultured Desulfuromonas sp.]
MSSEFFRQITLLVCRSLDIKEVANDCFEYLQDFLPLDAFFISLFDPDSGTLSRIAYASYDIENKVDEIVYLPQDLLVLYSEMIDGEAKLVADTQLDSFCRLMEPYVHNKGYSEIILPLRIADHVFGTLVARARKPNSYSEEHRQLLTSVREPFSIATSNALRHQELFRLKEKLNRDNQLLRNELQIKTGTKIIGAQGGLSHVLAMAKQVAPLNSTVLLLGETGVGKEVIASTIHYASARKNGPFIKVNCGAIPETLLDSELFGHEKGAFSGAVSMKRGRFERADGGTLFLDEIGELPLEAQTRLLRVLQSKEIERVGGSDVVSVDIRVIAATNRDLEKMVKNNQFRQDLWFRLNTYPIVIPSLKQRREDIPDLVEYFINRKSKELGFREPPPIASGAIDFLMQHHWPGNIRELENVVERALIQNKGRTLSQNHFSLSNQSNHVDNTSSCLFPCLAKQYLQTTAAHPQKEPEAPPSFKLDDMTRQHIIRCLEMTGGKIHGNDGAAELLGINANTLRSRMKKLDIPFGKKSYSF